MADQTITLTLPYDLYRRFQQHAVLKQQSLEEDVLSLATNALAEDELPADMQQAVSGLSQLDTAALWQAARRQLPPKQAKALETLLFKQQREGLTPAEKAQLEQLRQEHDLILLVRASAMGLLQERGEDIGPLLVRS